jgi:hypothetical protein
MGVSVFTEVLERLADAFQGTGSLGSVDAELDP